MKKLLTILGATGLVVSTSSILVSCESKNDDEVSVIEVSLTIGNDLKNKQTTIKLNNIDESKNSLSLRFKNGISTIGETPIIRNDIVNAELNTTSSIVLIEAIKGGSTIIEVVSTMITEDESDESIFINNVNEEVIKTINITVIDETPTSSIEDDTIDSEDQTSETNNSNENNHSHTDPENPNDNNEEEELEFEEGESNTSEEENNNQDNHDDEETFD